MQVREKLGGRVIMKRSRFSKRKQDAVETDSNDESMSELDRPEALIRAHKEDLSAPSKVLGRLLLVLGDEGHRRVDVESLMRSDGTLSAKVLRVANSSKFRGREVADIGSAMMRLGEDELSRIAIRASAACMKVESVDGYGMHDGGLWSHGMRCAVAAELLADHCKGVDGGVAYTAGLLLDVGKRVLGVELQDLIEIAFSENEGIRTFDEVEQALLGCTHAEISGALAAEWELPLSLENALRWHHRPQECPDKSPLVWVCHVADFLAMNLGGGGSVEGLAYRLEDGWQNCIDLEEEELIALLPIVQDLAAAVLDEAA